MTSFLADIPKLVQELGFEPLPAEKRTEYLLSLEEIISSRVNVAVLERLSEEGHSLFISLIEQGRDEDALTYVREQVADFADLVRRVAGEAIEEFLFLKKKHATQ